MLIASMSAASWFGSVRADSALLLVAPHRLGHRLSRGAAGGMRVLARQ
jgi:hypothetical protein